jgi:hypothetical protein
LRPCDAVTPDRRRRCGRRCGPGCRGSGRTGGRCGVFVAGVVLHVARGGAGVQGERDCRKAKGSTARANPNALTPPPAAYRLAFPPLTGHFADHLNETALPQAGCDLHVNVRSHLHGCLNSYARPAGLHALGRGCAAADDEPGRHGDGALDVLVLQPEDHLVGEQVLLAHELSSDSLGRPTDLDARCGSAVEARQAEIALTSWKITRSCRDLKGARTAQPGRPCPHFREREVTAAGPAETCIESPSRPDRPIEVGQLKHGIWASSAT